MKVLVCGGRLFADRVLVFSRLDAFHAANPITLIIQGGATGADALAKDWARARRVPMIQFDAEWNKHGNNAGPIRNAKMLTDGKPDIVFAFKGGKGTNHMANLAHHDAIQFVVVAVNLVALFVELRLCAQLFRYEWVHCSFPSFFAFSTKK